jgi:hypothetical protein
MSKEKKLFKIVAKSKDGETFSRGILDFTEEEANRVLNKLREHEDRIDFDKEEVKNK